MHAMRIDLAEHRKKQWLSVSAYLLSDLLALTLRLLALRLDLIAYIDGLLALIVILIAIRDFRIKTKTGRQALTQISGSPGTLPSVIAKREEHPLECSTSPLFLPQ